MDSLEITEMKTELCESSRFIAKSKITFCRNGKEREHDVIDAHDGVFVLIFNTTRQAFVLVKQFRPSLFMMFNPTLKNNIENVTESDVPFSKGVSHECCAGIVEVPNTPLVEIVRSEILEETGYDCPLHNIKRLFEVSDNSGVTSSLEHLYYAEVSDEMKVGEGGGLVEEGEFIDIVYLPLKEAKEFMFRDDVLKTGAEMSAFCWFFWKNGM